MFVYRRLSLEDVPAWAELLAAAFGRQVVEMEALGQWFHRSWEMVAWGAWADDRLVAQYSCLVNQVMAPAGMGVLKVGLSVNMAVHPDFRGRGLIKQVAQPVYRVLAENGAVAGVGFSNAAGVKVDQRSQGYGYQVLGQLPPRLLWFTRIASPPVPVTLTHDWPTQPWQLQAEPSNQFRFALSPNMLQTRYAGHPFRQYRYGVRHLGGVVDGIVIDRPVRRAGVSGTALLAAYGADLPGLLAAWGQAVRATGVRFVHWLATPASAVNTAIRPLGLSLPIPYSRSPYYLTAKPLSHHLPPGFLALGQWDCLGGDVL